MSIEEKLRHFEESALGAAKVRKESVVNETEAAFSEACVRVEREIRTKMSNMLRNEISLIDRDHNKKLTDAAKEAKLALLSARDDTTDKIFDKVRQRITKYVESAEYAEKLKNAAVKTRAQFAGHITFRVTQRDFAVIGGCFAADDCDVEADGETDILGGFLAETDANVIIDCTFAGRLNEARASFNKVKVV